MDHLTGHFKILLTMAATQATGMTLADYNVVASIFAYACGGIASICVAYHHLKKVKIESNHTQKTK